jgi:hypothetical protein
MTETIKITKEDEVKSKILTCHICTLSQAMKLCAICPFNIGLSVPVEVKTVVTL